MREASSRQLGRRVARIVAPVFRARRADEARAMYHVAVGMLEKCCPGAARVMEEAEPDALAYLDFPPSHWKRPGTNNLQEGTDRETRRRSRVVQVFPSTASPVRLAGAVMCEQDEAWEESRYFAEGKIAELYDEARGPEEARPESELQEFARRAIESSLELADRLEVA